MRRPILSDSYAPGKFLGLAFAAYIAYKWNEKRKQQQQG